MVQVPQLEGRSRRLEDEDEEDGDDREPELRVAEFARATAAHLNEEGPPRDEEQHERRDEGQEEGADVEEVAPVLPPDTVRRVHADLGVVAASRNLVLVEIVAEIAHLREEDGGHGE